MQTAQCTVHTLPRILCVYPLLVLLTVHVNSLVAVHTEIFEQCILLVNPLLGVHCTMCTCLFDDSAHSVHSAHCVHSLLVHFPSQPLIKWHPPRQHLYLTQNLSIFFFSQHPSDNFHPSSLDSRGLPNSTHIRNPTQFSSTVYKCTLSSQMPSAT